MTAAIRTVPAHLHMRQLLLVIPRQHASSSGRRDPDCRCADRRRAAASTDATTGIVALGREPDRLYNPSTLDGQLVANLVFDPLVGLDDQMNPYPVLAESIPGPDNSLVRLSGDGGDRRLIVTMPLRQGVTWADGEPFTADDVVYTWQLMMNPQSGFDTTVEDKLKSVDKVDDFTVRFTYLSANEARRARPRALQEPGRPAGRRPAVYVWPV